MTKDEEMKKAVTDIIVDFVDYHGSEVATEEYYENYRKVALSGDEAAFRAHVKNDCKGMYAKLIDLRRLNIITAEFYFHVKKVMEANEESVIEFWLKELEKKKQNA